MAEEKRAYPMLPIAHWWALRTKFQQSIPGVVTDGYLATVLSMGANSARANVLPFLKTLGIIDEEGKTGQRAKQWRDDAQYAQVCKEILKQVYPQELLDAVTDASHRAQAERWFANETGAGKSAAQRMAALYCLLTEADASKQPGEKPARVRGEKKPERKHAVEAAPTPTTAPDSAPAISGADSKSLQAPGIRINLEIHISADATPDQIDAIFASMARHIYRRG